MKSLKSPKCAKRHNKENMMRYFISLVLLGLITFAGNSAEAGKQYVCTEQGNGDYDCVEAGDRVKPVYRCDTIGSPQTNANAAIVIAGGVSHCNQQQQRPEVVENSCQVSVNPLNEGEIHSGRHTVSVCWYEYPQ